MTAIVRLGPAHCALVVDASTSMGGSEREVVAGVDEQVRALLESATDRVPLTVVTFSDGARIAYQGDVARFERLAYATGGNTALLDALGLALDELEPEVESPENAARPATGLVVVFTDGQENSSRRWSVEMTRARIERLRATGRWTFVLVGPAETLDQTCSALAIPRANAHPFGRGAAGAPGGFKAVAAAIPGYMDARARGLGSSEDYFAGALPPKE